MTDWLHRMLDFGSPTTGQVLAFNGTNYEPTSLEGITASLTRPGSVTGTANIRIVTTNTNGASSPDEIENADLVLDGTNDAADINSYLATAVAANANKIIHITASGLITLETSISLPANSWVIFESAYPSSGVFGEELTTFQVLNGTFTSGNFAFNAAGANVRLILRDVHVTQATSSGNFKLTNARHVYIDRCTVEKATQLYVPQTGTAVFIARESLLSGSSTAPLLRAGWGGDGTSSTPSMLIIKECTAINATGPILKWDNCAYVDITNSYFNGSGTNALLHLRQDITDAGATWPTRPPAYRQFLTGNRIVSTPASPSASPNAEPPFLQLTGIRGMIVTDNLCTFDCLSSGQYYTSNGNFVIIENYSMANTIADNKFIQATGSTWDHATPSLDGKYVPARIYLDSTTSNNGLRNSQQLLTDNGTDNDFPIDSYIFSCQTGFIVGESPRWPIRKTSYLYEAVATLTIAGSTTTTADITVNGVVIGTISFASGEVNASTTFESKVNKNDYLALDITAVGTNAGDMVVAIRGYY